jgi:UPF0755 protein
MKLRRVVLALLAMAAAASVLSLGAPYRGFDADVFVDIPVGTRSTELARMLAEAGVLRSRWEFLAVRVLHPRAKLKAGEYRFRESASPWNVFRRMEAGDVFYYELTVPEGNNSFDIAAAVGKLGTIRPEDFLGASRDSSPIRDLAPEAATLEGYLFPDTYRVTRHTTAAQLCRQMTERFRTAWAKLGAKRPVHSVVTMASLVEKETGRDGERPVIASVFQNRLARSMPLDCDPTAIYAALLERRYFGELSRSDLASRNRYNTYQYAGLPPGPIASPGLAALDAALHPADTRYLYFVAKADGSGTHTFSEDLEAHSLAVGKYRRANLKRNQAGAVKPVPGRQPSRPNR